MKYALGLFFLAGPLFSFASVKNVACNDKENLRKKMNVISSNIANVNTTYWFSPREIF